MEVYKPGMAWTGRIESVEPIPGADRIQRAEVDCMEGGTWTGVVPTSASGGDKVVVFMPDAIVPRVPPLEFMEKHKWRVKMQRLRGCPSEVLIVPFGDLFFPDMDPSPRDVTNLLGVLKYEKPVPGKVSNGEPKGSFPQFIPKTDEPNFQKCGRFRSDLDGVECYIATKYDGTSQTFFHRNGEIGGCSRNLQLRDTPDSTVWQIAHRHSLPEKLPIMGNLALQWECVGPGIQKNPLNLKEIEPRLFDIYDIDAQEYLDFAQMFDIGKQLGLPIVDHWHTLGQFWSSEDLRSMAAGRYRESGANREGIVIRPLRTRRVCGSRVSFKVINLDYKES